MDLVNNLTTATDGTSNINPQGQANGSLSSSPEKPLHYSYLKGFRVEQCALFLQHKCTNHKPYTCFDWHFQNQRRRRPVRRRDGTFNYSPDTYCTKYDETTGICPDKDDCPYLHKTAGDTERRYHLRYYKTGICVYETDSRGYCSKNGKHCAFAHGAHDLRNPVFDVRELQALENGNTSGELSDTSGLLTGPGGTSMDRERNALLEDPRWTDTAFVLANYKTVLCKRPPRFCRQGYACPQYHNGKDRRRSPKIHTYRSTPCPSTKQGDEWVDPSKCEQGDQCPYCHSRTEQQFHPEIFKSTKCKDIQDTGYCPRGAFCAFAHNDEEIIATRDINLDGVEGECSIPLLSQSYPGGGQLLISHQMNEVMPTASESQLDDSLEGLLSFNKNGDVPSRIDDDDDDIFSSNNIRRMSDRNDNIILGAQDNSDTDSIVNNLLGIDPVIRPSAPVTTPNNSLFSPSGIDFCAGSILQQQKVVSAVPSVGASNSYLHGPGLTNSLDINISNNQNELNLSNSLSARSPNNSLVNSIANTYNMDLGNNFATANNSRLSVSFADQNESALPSSSLTNNAAAIQSQTKNNLGPIARPRSYSHSQARSINTEINQLHAALARARLIDEFRNQGYSATNNSNSIGFRERAVHSFSISSVTNEAASLLSRSPVSALDFLPSGRLSNLNLGTKDVDFGQIVGNSQTNSLANHTKPLSPNSNGLIVNNNNLSNSSDNSTNTIPQGQANGSLSSSPEKPLHYTYLKGFRVEQCALFLQHKCTNHKPYTCFDWHFQNQRRRRPVRRRDGTFNYSPDTYCTKYDETTGICPDKDDCPYLHKTAGDTERRYHLRYYKTGICVYETDSRGYCSKNGKHCAFAHGAHDLRNPVFDVRELQALENGNTSGELSDTSGLLTGPGGTSMDRERNALLEDPRWTDTAFVLANYKTVLCKRPPRFCRQGYACPQYHNGKDRRRSPKIHTYRSTPCPSTKQGDEWVDPSKCEQGDQCPYCHSRTEQQFHPEIFKSTKCKDIQDTGYCPRGAFCAFAHNDEEIIATRDINLEKVHTLAPCLQRRVNSIPETELNPTKF